MSKRNLGLPLEYQQMHEFFDATNVGADTQAKNAVIEGLLKKYQVNTVLDVTCGTGSQVFFLAARGYQVVGADFSPALLAIARERARAEKVDVAFIDGDMRTVRIGTFDAVISIFNAIGHLTKSGFLKALRNINHNVKNGGIYVFDIFNLDAMTDEVIADFACYVHKRVGDTLVHTAQCSTLDHETGILTSYNTYLIQKNAEKPQLFRHTFSLQIYTAQQLRDILAHAGFKIVEQCGIDGTPFVPNKTRAMVTVARKVD